MIIPPWQFVKGEALPVVLAYKYYPNVYRPNLDYATVQIGPDANQKTVMLHSETGNPLGTGSHSIEFSDASGGDYYEICNDADWWYTVGYISANDYLDTQYWQGDALPIQATYHWKKWPIDLFNTTTSAIRRLASPGW